MDEMVKFVSEVTQPNQRQVIQWVGMDTDQLTPTNSFVSSEKKRMTHFYMTLLKSIQNNN
jgi:hypothetical protein